VEGAIGRREPSVRELFRTASALAQTFIMRPPSGQNHPAGHAAVNGAGADPRRSQDAPGRAKSGALKGADLGSKPSTPDDMA
jgi:hypothetical protein